MQTQQQCRLDGTAFTMDAYCAWLLISMHVINGATSQPIHSQLAAWSIAGQLVRLPSAWRYIIQISISSSAMHGN